MTKDIVISRPLCPEENFFRCRTAVDWYRNFGSVAAYSKDLSDPQLLFRALRKTILDYHILICNVFHNREAGFTEMRPIKHASFGDLVEFAEELFSTEGKKVPEWLLSKICRTLYFSLYVEKPLFKLIVYGTHDLAFTVEHTLADGVVALSFHEIFLDNLAYCADSQNLDSYVAKYGPIPDVIDENTTVFDLETDLQYIKHSLPPPVDMFMEDPSLDYSDGDEKHFSKVAPSSHPEKWPGRFPTSLEFTTAFKLINLAPTDLKVILQKCKEHGVLLTSYIACNQALVLQPIYGSQHHTLCVVAMTLRRFILLEKLDVEYRNVLEPSYKLLGNYAHMGVPQFFAPLTEFSWERVKKFQRNLSLSVVNNKLLNMRKPIYDSLEDFSDNSHLFEKALSKNKADSLKLSNIGAGRFTNHKNGWTVNDIVFAQDLAPNASEFVLNMVSSQNGGLNIVLSYFDHSFEDSDHQNFDEYPILLKEALLKNAS